MIVVSIRITVYRLDVCKNWLSKCTLSMEVLWFSLFFMWTLLPRCCSQCSVYKKGGNDWQDVFVTIEYIKHPALATKEDALPCVCWTTTVADLNHTTSAMSPRSFKERCLTDSICLITAFWIKSWFFSLYLHSESSTWIYLNEAASNLRLLTCTQSLSSHTAGVGQT